MLILAVILGVISILTFVPCPYRLTAEGRLLPAERQRVFAPWEGDIVELLVESGQRVTVGTPLVQLENEELHQQLVAARNELEETTQHELSLQSEIDLAHREGNREQEIRLRGERLESQAKINGLKEQVTVLEIRYENLLVKAKSNGVVATFQLEQQLRHRPVTRGDLLMEIMRTNGPWELNVEIPDHRMGHLLQRLADTNGKTPVEFVLQTDTEKTYSGELLRENLGTRSSVTKEGKSIVEARIPLPDDVPTDRRIGAEVTTKINCGPMTLAYVLFGDVLEFVKRSLWL